MVRISNGTKKVEGNSEIRIKLVMCIVIERFDIYCMGVMVMTVCGRKCKM